MNKNTLSLKKNGPQENFENSLDRQTKRKFVSAATLSPENNPSKEKVKTKKPFKKNVKRKPEMTVENALHKVLTMKLVGLNKQYKDRNEAMSVLKNLPFNKKVLVITSKSNNSFRKQFKDDYFISVRTEGRTNADFVLKHDVVVLLDLI